MLRHQILYVVVSPITGVELCMLTDLDHFVCNFCKGYLSCMIFLVGEDNLSFRCLVKGSCWGSCSWSCFEVWCDRLWRWCFLDFLEWCSCSCWWLPIWCSVLLFCKLDVSVLCLQSRCFVFFHECCRWTADLRCLWLFFIILSLKKVDSLFWLSARTWNVHVPKWVICCC